MRVLILGGCGYIGSRLSQLRLLKPTTLDRCDYGPLTDGYRVIKGDMGDDHIRQKLVWNSDVVVHLAGPRQSDSTHQRVQEIIRASEKLVQECENKNLVFASTCSVYGSNAELVDEVSEVNPQDDYARMKVEIEKMVLDNSGIVLRFATAYGDSPLIRRDLIVHELIAEATTGFMQVYGPEKYRPLCHVDDLARAIVFAVHELKPGIYNVGGENWQKKDLVNLITKKLNPHAKIETVEHGDPRNYQVSFDKIQKAGFKPEIALKDWI